MRTEWVDDWRLTYERAEEVEAWQLEADVEGRIHRNSLRGLGTVGSGMNIMMMKIIII
jgi:hypothetical protein